MAEEREWLVYGGRPPARADALRFNIDACRAYARRRRVPADAAAWRGRRAKLKAALAEALGLDLNAARAPLHARVTGRSRVQGCRVENVVLESRPHFYVTANLYAPVKLKAPAPAVLVAMGHAMKEGKNYAPYQTAQIGLAKQGFVVLGFDPIGQGERNRPGMSHAMGFGSLLVGRTNEGFIVWDAMRCVDYLCSRPEVDPNRIGMAGNSGGGEAVFYTMPFEERIRAGASFCFVCSYDAWIARGGSHCICNHLPGVVRRMEEFEIIGLTAPRPFLFGNGAQDPIFPIDGTRVTYERARRVYAMLGAAEAVRSVEARQGHGWSKALREAAYGWFAGWLQNRGRGGPLPEPRIRPLPADAAALRCFKDGRWPKDAETIVSLNRRRAARLIRGYSRPPASRAEWKRRRAELVRALWRVLGGKPRARAPRARAAGRFSWKGRLVERIALETEAAFETPVLLIRPDDRPGRRPALIYVDSADKTAARASPVVKEALRAGFAVLAMNPRGEGEAAAPPNQTATDAIVLGRPLFAQSLWDVMQAARCLASRSDVDPRRIFCHGYGPSGLLAVFAAALDDRIAGASAERSIASFAYAIENRQRQPLWVFAPRLLEVCDLAQAAALASPKPITLAQPMGYAGRKLSLERAEAAMAFARRVAELEKAADSLRLEMGGDAAAARQVLRSYRARARP